MKRKKRIYVIRNPFTWHVEGYVCTWNEAQIICDKKNEEYKDKLDSIHKWWFYSIPYLYQKESK